MADLMGNWVQPGQIEQVLNVCALASQHTFQLLTKNAPRLLKFGSPLTSGWACPSLRHSSAAMS